MEVSKIPANHDISRKTCSPTASDHFQPYDYDIPTPLLQMEEA